MKGMVVYHPAERVVEMSQRTESMFLCAKDTPN